MHRGVEVEIHLRPDLNDDNFVARALGNLAGFRLQSERHEPLEWQVLRVNASGGHHYRLVLRHPARLLDLGFKSQLESLLRDLSEESMDQLRDRVRRAEIDGLRLVPLRSVREEVDFWEDDFWKSLG